MSETPTYACYRGTVGWQHAEWLNTFYPDDLPSEWQLTYYATAFSCVYLPAPAWSNAATQMIAQWRDDTPERFRFLLEVNDAVDPRADVAATLAPRVVWLDARKQQPIEGAGRLRWIDPAVDLKALAAELQSVGASERPLYLVQRTPDAKVAEDVRVLLELLGL